jgi:hypothetical protein
MERENSYIEEDRISIREMFLGIGNLFKHLLSRWLKISVYTTVIAAILIILEVFSKEVFTAETTFIIEKEQSGASDFGKAAADLVGISLGSMGQQSGLFDTDHIEKLYLSNRMLKETFLTPCTIRKDSARLITHLGKHQKLLNQWSGIYDNGDFSFEIPIEEYTIKHDSILLEVFEDFKEKQLIVDRPDRKLEILSVKVNSSDQLFAKRFNEVLVNKVNNFYLDVKTRNTGENVRVLKIQMDSLKALLDYKLEYMDSLNRRFPNVNPNFSSLNIENAKVNYEIEATGEAYVEIAKSYEMAKMSHLNSTPIIQLLDVPVLPLRTNKEKLLKTIVISIFIGGVLSVIYILGSFFFQQIMNPKNRL